jgi:Ger(x)C family germination protein
MQLLLKRILILILLFPLCGCWDRREIEQRMSVSAIAIDQKEGGENYEITIQVPIPKQIVSGSGSAGGGGGGKPVQQYSATGKTISEALSRIQEQMNMPFFFGNTQVILFSEDVARKGLNPFLDFFRRTQQIRRQLWPVIIKGSAKDALKVESNIEQIPTDYLRDLLENGVRSGISTQTTLGMLLSDISSRSRQAPVLNYVEANKNAYRWIGLALFKRDRLIDIVSDESEATPVLQLRENLQGMVASVPCPDGKQNIVFRPLKAKREISVNKNNELNVTVKVRGILMENPCQVDFSQADRLNQFKKRIEDKYRIDAMRMIRRAQKEWKTDVFEFGREVYAYYPSVWKREYWQKQFSNMNISLHYEVEIESIGVSSK